MQKIIIAVLLTGFIAATATSPVNAAGGSRAPAAVAPAGTTTGLGSGGVAAGAGSGAAGAAGVSNPSGNSLMNTSPSGSTLMPNTGATVGGGGRRR
jgi:hypothetical protein